MIGAQSRSLFNQKVLPWVSDVTESEVSKSIHTLLLRMPLLEERISCIARIAPQTQAFKVMPYAR